jgi:hypothetical protein
MTASQIRFFTLPNSVSRDGHVRISLFVSPIAVAGQSVPRFLSAWPAIADSLQFGFDIKDAQGTVQGTSYRARRLLEYPDGESLENTADAMAAWRSFFPSSTNVAARHPVPATDSVLAAPTADIHNKLKGFYGEVASGTALNQVINEVVAYQGKLEELARFHGRCSVQGPRLDPSEFHARLSYLCQYPSAMRLVRMIIDLQIEDLQASDLPTGGSFSGYLSGIAPQAPPEAADLTNPNQVVLSYPWTRYALSLSPSGFTTATPGAERFGIAALGSSQYVAATLDLDAGGLGLLKHVVYASTARKDALTALPDRRGNGIQVFDVARGQNIPTLSRQADAADVALSAHITPFGQRPLADAGIPSLDSSYFQYGFRIDAGTVDKKMPVRSLCRRRVAVLDLPMPRAHEEDAAVVSGISSAPDNAVNALNQAINWKSSQLLFGWNGWSLTVPRPRPITDPPQPDHPIKAFVSPQTLTRLRFGEDYVFRARAVDIAGNGCSAEEATKLERALTLPNVWLSVPFRRNSVVPPPSIVADGSSANSAVVVVSHESTLHAERTLRLAPPTGSFNSLQLAGALDSLHDAGHQAVREGFRGLKHFKDPSSDGVVASVGRSLENVPLGAPDYAVLEFRPEGASGREVQSILVEANHPLEIRCRADRQLLLKAENAHNAIALNVPRGRVVEFLLRSFIPDAKLGQLELYGIPPSNFRNYGRQYSTLAGPLRLCVVHATEKPLIPPAFGAIVNSPPVLVDRQFGATAATFTASNVSLDRESTRQLGLEAVWEEVSDQVDKDGKWPERTKVSASLASIDVTLPSGHPWHRTSDKSTPPAGTVNIQGVHGFGDGKYRHLDPVFLLATSRFSNYFPTHENDNPLRFCTKSSPITISVPASVPPAAPKVSYVVPTIGRSGISVQGNRMERRTEVWALRVYLLRDWFSSGDGERLAVILGSSDPDPNGLSEFGSDPARQGDKIEAQLSANDFRNGIHSPDVLRLKGSPSSLTDVDHLDVMTFPAALDQSKNLLYADVVFSPRKCYRPFVRFALARYQQNALPIAQLSSTVVADFIQLGPERFASIRREGEALHVAVTGPASGQTGTPFRSSVVAIAETRRDLADPWIERERVVLSPGPPAATGEVTWTGEIHRTPGRSRIVVQEFEVVSDGIGDGANPGEIELAGRLVFADSFEY